MWVPSTVSGMDGRRSRLPLAIARRGGRRRCGDVPAPAAQRPDRARPGRARNSTSRPSSSTARRTSAAPSAILGLAGLALGMAHARGARLAAAARPARAARVAAAARRRRGGGGHLAAAGGDGPAARGRGRTSARSTWGSPPRPGRTGLGTWPRSAGHRRGHRRHRRPAWRWRWSAASRAAGGRPAPLLVVAFGVVTIWLFPVVIDPLFNELRAAAARDQLRDGRARARRPRRRGRGRGLPRRREPPDHARERLRERARAHEAGGALRQPDRRASRATRCSRGGPRARPPEAQRPAARPRLAGDRGAGRHASSPRRWPSASAGARARRPDAPGPRLPAIALAVALVALGLGSRVERALAPGGGERRLVLARPDARPGDFTRLRAPDRGPQHRPTPDPPRLLHLAVRHPSHDASSGSGIGEAWRARARLPRRVAPRPDRAGRPRAGLVRAPVGLRRRAAGGGMARRRAPRAPAAARCASRRSAPTAATGGRSGS